MPGAAPQLQVLEVIVQLVAGGEEIREQLVVAGDEAAIVVGGVFALEQHLGVAARHGPPLHAVAHHLLLAAVLDVHVQEEAVEVHLVIGHGVGVAEDELGVCRRPEAPSVRDGPIQWGLVVAPGLRWGYRARRRSGQEHALLVAPLLNPLC